MLELVRDRCLGAEDKSETGRRQIRLRVGFFSLEDLIRGRGARPGSDSTDKNVSAFDEPLLLPRRSHHGMTNCPSHRQDLMDDLTEEMTENFKLVI